MKKAGPHLILPTGEIFPLKGNTSLGRSEQCSIRLEGPKVSRDHTHIYEIGGKYQVVDSQSRNGTYLNDVRLKRPTTLKDGDRVSVGGHELKYHDGAAPHLPFMTFASTVPTMEAWDQIPSWLLVADIKDSTNLAQQMGVEGYSSLVSRWFNDCRLIIEQQGGVINHSTGDGLLAYWKDPGNEAAKQVAAGLLQLKESQKAANPEFRIVVHHGNVGYGTTAGVGDESLSGADVHFIFRMEKVLGGTGWMLGGTQPAIELLQPWISHQEIGQFALKGFDGVYMLYGLYPEEPEQELPPEIESL